MPSAASSTAKTAPATPASMRAYYAQRAASYEDVYRKPERQADLRAIEAWLPRWFKGRRVIEIACGTGWWTPYGARDAQHWLATDANPEVIEIARGKPLPAGKVHFALTDAYTLAELGRAQFSAAFAGCWWSHVPQQDLVDWLGVLHQRLVPGSQIVVLDNRYVEGSSHPITRRDAQGNSYQMRTLPDGSVHEVLKNFPDEQQVRRAVGARAIDLKWHAWPHYWACTWQVAD